MSTLAIACAVLFTSITPKRGIWLLVGRPPSARSVEPSVPKLTTPRPAPPDARPSCALNSNSAPDPPLFAPNHPSRFDAPVTPVSSYGPRSLGAGFVLNDCANGVVESATPGSPSNDCAYVPPLYDTGPALAPAALSVTPI